MEGGKEGGNDGDIERDKGRRRQMLREGESQGAKRMRNEKREKGIKGKRERVFRAKMREREWGDIEGGGDRKRERLRETKSERGGGGKRGK